MLKNELTKKQRAQYSFPLRWRLGSIVVLFFFLINSCFYPADIFAQTINASVGSQSAKPPSIHELKVPDEFALLEEVYQNPEAKPNDPVIVYVQDAHCVYEAQNNIRKIIDHFQKENNLRLVALEGGEGRVDPVLFRSFPVKEVKEKVIDRYVRRGELSGAEYAAIVNENPSDFWGIEDMDVYYQNKKAFLNAIEENKRITTKLENIERWLKKKKDEIYSDNLKQMYRKTHDYDKEILDLLQYIEYLTAQWKALKGDLGSYPNIHALLVAVDREQKSDFRLIQSEAVRLEKELERYYKNSRDPAMKEGLEILTKRITAFRQQKIQKDKFYPWLWIEGKTTQVINGQTLWSYYPNLSIYIKHLKEMEQIQGDALFSEIDEMKKKIKEAWFENEDQKTLDRFFYQLKILNNLSKLELTREELAYYQDNQENFREVKFWDFIGNKIERFELDELFEPHQNFYAVALKRDHVLHQNLLNVMQQTNQKFALVLTGGFHAKGIKQKLKDSQVSYMVLTPRITHFGEDPIYWNVMKGRVSYAKYKTSTLSPELALSAFKDAVSKAVSEDYLAEISKVELASTLNQWKDLLLRSVQEQDKSVVDRYASFMNQLIDRLILGKVDQSEAEDIISKIAQELQNSVDLQESAFIAKVDSFEKGIETLTEAGSLTSDSVDLFLKTNFPQRAEAFSASSLGQTEIVQSLEGITERVLSSIDYPGISSETIVGSQLSETGTHLYLLANNQQLLMVDLETNEFLVMGNPTAQLLDPFGEIGIANSFSADWSDASVLGFSTGEVVSVQQGKMTVVSSNLSSITQFAVGPNNTLFSGNINGEIHLVDLSNPQNSKRIAPRLGFFVSIEDFIPTEVSSLIVTTDGSRLVSVHNREPGVTIRRLVNLDTGKVTNELNGTVSTQSDIETFIANVTVSEFNEQTTQLLGAIVEVAEGASLGATQQYLDSIVDKINATLGSRVVSELGLSEENFPTFVGELLKTAQTREGGFRELEQDLGIYVATALEQTKRAKADVNPGAAQKDIGQLFQENIGGAFERGGLFSKIQPNRINALQQLIEIISGDLLQSDLFLQTAATELYTILKNSGVDKEEAAEIARSAIENRENIIDLIQIANDLSIIRIDQENLTNEGKLDVGAFFKAVNQLQSQFSARELFRLIQNFATAETSIVNPATNKNRIGIPADPLIDREKGYLELENLRLTGHKVSPFSAFKPYGFVSLARIFQELLSLELDSGEREMLMTEGKIGNELSYAILKEVGKVLPRQQQLSGVEINQQIDALLNNSFNQLNNMLQRGADFNDRDSNAEISQLIKSINGQAYFLNKQVEQLNGRKSDRVLLLAELAAALKYFQKGDIEGAYSRLFEITRHSVVSNDALKNSLRHPNIITPGTEAFLSQFEIEIVEQYTTQLTNRLLNSLATGKDSGKRAELISLAERVKPGSARVAQAKALTQAFTNFERAAESNFFDNANKSFSAAQKALASVGLNLEQLDAFLKRLDASPYRSNSYQLASVFRNIIDRANRKGRQLKQIKKDAGALDRIKLGLSKKGVTDLRLSLFKGRNRFYLLESIEGINADIAGKGLSKEQVDKLIVEIIEQKQKESGLYLGVGDSFTSPNGAIREIDGVQQLDSGEVVYKVTRQGVDGIITRDQDWTFTEIKVRVLDTNEGSLHLLLDRAKRPSEEFKVENVLEQLGYDPTNMFLFARNESENQNFTQQQLIAEGFTLNQIAEFKAAQLAKLSLLVGDLAPYTNQVGQAIQLLQNPTGDYNQISLGAVSVIQQLVKAGLLSAREVAPAISKADYVIESARLRSSNERTLQVVESVVSQRKKIAQLLRQLQPHIQVGSSFESSIARVSAGAIISELVEFVKSKGVESGLSRLQRFERSVLAVMQGQPSISSFFTVQAIFEDAGLGYTVSLPAMETYREVKDERFIFEDVALAQYVLQQAREEVGGASLGSQEASEEIAFIEGLAGEVDIKDLVRFAKGSTQERQGVFRGFLGRLDLGERASSYSAEAAEQLVTQLLLSKAPGLKAQVEEKTRGLERAPPAERESTSVQDYVNISDQLATILGLTNVENFEQLLPSIEAHLNFQESLIPEVLDSYTSGGSISQSVYEAAIDYYFQLARQKVLTKTQEGKINGNIDLSLLTLPVGAANSLLNQEMGSALKQLMMEKVKSYAGGNVKINRESGSNQAYSGTRIVAVGLDPSQLSTLVQSDFNAVKETLKLQFAERLREKEVEKGLSSGELDLQIDALNIFGGHTLINGEGIVSDVRELLDEDKAQDARLLIEEELAQEIKRVTARAELQEKYYKEQGVLGEDSGKRAPPEEFRKGEAKYIPQANFDTGLITRVYHEVGGVKQRLNRLRNSLKQVQLAIKFNRGKDTVENRLRRLNRDYATFLAFYDKAFIRSLQDVRYTRSYNLNSGGLARIVKADVDGSLSRLRQRIGRHIQSADLDNHIIKQMEQLLNDTEEGFHVTKLGDEIGLVYRVDGKLIMTFLELDKFNAFNEAFPPDIKDSYFHGILESIRNLAIQEFGVNEGITAEQNQAFLNKINEVIAKSEIEFTDAAYEGGLDVKRADGTVITTIQEGDKALLGDLNFQYTEKVLGNRLPTFRDSETGEVVVKDGAKILNLKGEYLGDYSDLKGTLSAIDGATGATITPDTATSLIGSDGTIIDLSKQFDRLGEVNGLQKKMTDIGGGRGTVLEASITEVAEAASLGSEEIDSINAEIDGIIDANPGILDQVLADLDLTDTATRAQISFDLTAREVGLETSDIQKAVGAILDSYNLDPELLKVSQGIVDIPEGLLDLSQLTILRRDGVLKRLKGLIAELLSAILLALKTAVGYESAAEKAEKNQLYTAKSISKNFSRQDIQNYIDILKDTKSAADLSRSELEGFKQLNTTYVTRPVYLKFAPKLETTQGQIEILEQALAEAAKQKGQELIGLFEQENLRVENSRSVIRRVIEPRISKQSVASFLKKLESTEDVALVQDATDRKIFEIIVNSGLDVFRDMAFIEESIRAASELLADKEIEYAMGPVERESARGASLGNAEFTEIESVLGRQMEAYITSRTDLKSLAGLDSGREHIDFNKPGVVLPLGAKFEKTVEETKRAIAARNAEILKEASGKIAAFSQESPELFSGAFDSAEASQAFGQTRAAFQYTSQTERIDPDVLKGLFKGLLESQELDPQIIKSIASKLEIPDIKLDFTILEVLKRPTLLGRFQQLLTYLLEAILLAIESLRQTEEVEVEQEVEVEESQDLDDLTLVFDAIRKDFSPSVIASHIQFLKKDVFGIENEDLTDILTEFGFLDFPRGAEGDPQRIELLEFVLTGVARDKGLELVGVIAEDRARILTSAAPLVRFLEKPITVNQLSAFINAFESTSLDALYEVPNALKITKLINEIGLTSVGTEFIEQVVQEALSEIVLRGIPNLVPETALAASLGQQDVEKVDLTNQQRLSNAFDFGFALLGLSPPSGRNVSEININEFTGFIVALTDEEREEFFDDLKTQITNFLNNRSGVQDVELKKIAAELSKQTNIETNEALQGILLDLGLSEDFIPQGDALTALRQDVLGSVRGAVATASLEASLILLERETPAGVSFKATFNEAVQGLVGPANEALNELRQASDLAVSSIFQYDAATFLALSAKDQLVVAASLGKNGKLIIHHPPDPKVVRALQTALSSSLLRPFRSQIKRERYVGEQPSDRTISRYSLQAQRKGQGTIAYFDKSHQQALDAAKEANKMLNDREFLRELEEVQSLLNGLAVFIAQAGNNKELRDKILHDFKDFVTKDSKGRIVPNIRVISARLIANYKAREAAKKAA